MRVLIVTDAWRPQVNGVVRTYEHFQQELLKGGHEVRVIGPSDFPLTLPMPFYNEIRLTLGPGRKLGKMIDAFSPDKIHIATEGPLGWAARSYCLKRGLVFTTSYHTQFPDYVAVRLAWLIPPLYRAVHRVCVAGIRHFHSPTQKLMVATESLERQLRAWGLECPIGRVSRGVDLDVFHPDEKNLFQNLPRPVALYVGRLSIEKNLEDFLKMDWSGSKVVVGDGPLKADLKARYKDVHFAGKKQGAELADYYRSADVFVFPSRTDTFGIVIIEALACGLPVAAYNVTGPKDIIVDPSLGALDDFDLARAARAAIKFGIPEKCVARVRENYCWELAAQQFLVLL